MLFSNQCDHIKKKKKPKYLLFVIAMIKYLAKATYGREGRKGSFGLTV